MKKTIDLVALDQIVPNPWRDLDLNPLDDDHIPDLRDSIKDFEFLGGLAGRRRKDGKIELAFGHARLAASRKARLEAIPVEIKDLDDDQMLRMMTDENALQSGHHPGAVMNEVAAVVEFLVERMIARIQGQSVHASGKTLLRAFENTTALETACTKLGKRMNTGTGDVPIGVNSILRYFGEGDEKKSRRGERQIREAISALKQSGRYDKFIDDVLSQHPIPVADKPTAKTTEIEQRPVVKRERILDERTAHVFPNDHQFHAFRDAVTSRSAQQIIPVDQQYKLAKKIMDPAGRKDFNKKQISAPFITKMVQAEVQDGMKLQKQIDKEEQEQYRREQVQEEIESELHSANSSIRSVLSALNKLGELAAKYPDHPKIGGFSARLDDLVAAIQQFSNKLKKARRNVA